MMIAKLYKGPKHGKTYQVRDDEWTIRVAAPIDNPWVMTDPTGPPTPVAIKTGTYRRTNNTHPDGSTFFVWEGWS